MTENYVPWQSRFYRDFADPSQFGTDQNQPAYGMRSVEELTNNQPFNFDSPKTVDSITGGDYMRAGLASLSGALKPSLFTSADELRRPYANFSAYLPAAKDSINQGAERQTKDDLSKMRDQATMTGLSESPFFAQNEAQRVADIEAQRQSQLAQLEAERRRLHTEYKDRLQAQKRDKIYSAGTFLINLVLNLSKLGA